MSKNDENQPLLDKDDDSTKAEYTVEGGNLAGGMYFMYMFSSPTDL